jgi:dynein heavy chain 1
MEDPVVQGANGVANGTPTAPTTNAVDPRDIIKYLSNVLEVTLGASTEELKSRGSLLEDSLIGDTLARCTRFALEAQVALYVLKDAVAGGAAAQINGDGAQEEQATYTLSSELIYTPRTLACVAFLKRPSPITSDLPVAKQLSVVNLPLSGIMGNGSDSGSSLSPYESLHSLLRGAIAPFFEAAARGSEPSSDKIRADGDSRTGITGARRRLAELDSSLLNLLQNSEVSEPKLQIHDAVLKQLEESDGDTTAAVAQIPDNILSNSNILNKLQAMANDWIRQIREFTKQADERPVGSATQEKNFWLAMETAIESIEEQLAGPGVSLTMKILEKAKRHGVTASFQSDTGLKEAKDRVQRYNQLFHGFPIEEVLNAGSVENFKTPSAKSSVT